MTASIALKENQSPAAEFNVNLVTAFSVIVREPRTMTMLMSEKMSEKMS